MGFWKLIGKMRKSQNFYKDSSKSYCIATYHTENFERLRFYFKDLNPSSFQLSYLFHWLHRGKSIFIFPWKNCFYDNTKKPKQLKQQTIQKQKTRVMCETGNWSHPRWEDPRSSDDENGSAGSTWQFDLQMSLLRIEHWWRSEAHDSARLCFEQFTRYIALQTSKYSTHFTYWISLQGKRWLAVQEGNKGLWLPLWTPHRAKDQGLGFSVGRAWALCAEPLQELEKAPLPGAAASALPSFSFTAIGKWLSSMINQLKFHKGNYFTVTWH